MMEDNKVAVLIEDLMSQFRTFGEGLQNLDNYAHGELSDIKLKLQDIDHKLERNSIEHQQLKQMIKELDTEVIKLKRVK
jgi:hypothetical protein